MRPLKRNFPSTLPLATPGKIVLLFHKDWDKAELREMRHGGTSICWTPILVKMQHNQTGRLVWHLVFTNVFEVLFFFRFFFTQNGF